MSLQHLIRHEVAGGGPLLSRRDWLGRTASVAIGSLALGTGSARAQATPAHRACIVLWMSGGASQLDTFDLKPGHANGGPFKPIETTVPGIQLSEHLPNLARHAKHLAIVRSMSTKEGDHERATVHMHTGYQRRINVDYPTFGSLVANENSPAGLSIPSFINIDPPPNLSLAYKPGFLGTRFAPLVLRPNPTTGATNSETDSQPLLRVENLLPPRGVARAQMESRAELLQALEQDFSIRQPDAVAQSHRIAYDRALRLMHPESASAFDLLQESAALREAYGNDPFGQGCLLARRLVERGVGFVEVTLGGGNQNWDTHAKNFTRVQELSANLDRGWSQLITDLETRGLLDSTLIVWMGEFGRTPVINTADGRDHFPGAWSTVLAGGGIKGGQTLGRTSADGMTVDDRPVSVPDFLSTVALALGINPAKQNLAADGQPIRIVDSAANPLRELLANG